MGVFVSNGTLSDFLLHPLHGIEAALTRKTRLTPPVAAKITGELEVQILAAALSPPPEGFARWTLRLLVEYCMENQYIVSISHTAIGDMLNTNELKPHLSKYWCIPKLKDAAFVANMEEPYNPEIPVICMDEKPVQLLGEIRERIQARPLHAHPDTPLPQPGYGEKIDSERDVSIPWRFIVRTMESIRLGKDMSPFLNRHHHY